jgi:hypothetical protein
MSANRSVVMTTIEQCRATNRKCVAARRRFDVARKALEDAEAALARARKTRLDELMAEEVRLGSGVVVAHNWICKE